MDDRFGCFSWWVPGQKVKLSHLIDMATGHSVTHRRTSVSVVDGDCGRADGFATVCLVWDPKRGER